MSLDEFKRRLLTVPDQRDPFFPFAVRQIAADVGIDAERFGRAILDAPAPPEAEQAGKLRFLALYLLLLVRWREFDSSGYRALVEQYAEDFDPFEYPYVLTFRSQYHLSKDGDGEEIEQALDYAAEAVAYIPDGAAVLHLEASCVARLAEIGSVPVELLERGERAVAKAIRVDRDLVSRGLKKHRFARYHATKARLLLIKGSNRDARVEVRKALELEDPRQAVRIAEYLEIRGQITLRENVDRVTGDLNRLKSDIEVEASKLERLRTDVVDQVRLQSVQLLGLLAAILAFLFTGTEIARNLEFRDGAKLMAVVGGIILIVFSAFAMIFYADRLERRRLLAALGATVLGAWLIVAGMTY